MLLAQETAESSPAWLLWVGGIVAVITAVTPAARSRAGARKAKEKDAVITALFRHNSPNNRSDRSSGRFYWGVYSPINGRITSMGACDFQNFVAESDDIKTAQQAFDHIVSHACYMHGHGGYTGTIAEKMEFDMLQQAAVDRDTADDLVRKELDHHGSDKFTDKWGPAGCVRVEDPEHGNGWMFFGYASS
jgi:hypothetical protein